MLALMEMVVNGVSVRKVARIMEEPSRTEFLKSMVSRLYESLDFRMRAFNERCFPFVLTDALYVKAREDEVVVSEAVLLVCG